MYDLLDEDLIGVRTSTTSRRVSLPLLLGLLCDGQVHGYTGLRAHQTAPWHVFLVQLAASILARRPQEQPPCDPIFWRDGLRELAEGQASAWHLIEDDVTQPAFLQHPWTSWEAEAGSFRAQKKRGAWVFDPKARTPDELDVLVTAKNHDVKGRRIAPTDIEAWLYALMVSQTTNGVLGAGNYGILRMNSGYGSRAIVSWGSSVHPSRRLLEELAILGDLRTSGIRQHGYCERGVVLTWLQKWDRKTHQYMPQDLEPWFIEACRPLRLRTKLDGSVVALSATSDARQVGPKNLQNGDVGDPWTAINVADKKKGRSALTVPRSGFTPKLVTELLFEQGFELTGLQKPRPGKEPGWLLASVLVRGQGTTEGFHHLELMVPAKACLTLARLDERQQLARLAQSLLADAKEASAALRTALTIFVEGGGEKPDFDRDAVKRWVEVVTVRFGQMWEQYYFPALWRGADEAGDAVQRDWQDHLVRMTQTLLEDALSRLPGTASRRWRAETRARGALFGILKKKHILPARSVTEEDFA
jgi:CRISPR system Cascade subunit CasA